VLAAPSAQQLNVTGLLKHYSHRSNKTNKSYTSNKINFISLFQKQKRYWLEWKFPEPTYQTQRKVTIIFIICFKFSLPSEKRSARMATQPQKKKHTFFLKVCLHLHSVLYLPVMKECMSSGARSNLVAAMTEVARGEA